MGQHGIDLACVGGEIVHRGRTIPVLAGDIIQNALIVSDIAIDRGAEIIVALVTHAYILKGLLTFQGVEATGETAPFAATIAFPGQGLIGIINTADDVSGHGFRAAASPG